MTDELNDILIECAKMRGCYPLMHRTLHEFNWFVSCCIFGWTECDQYGMDRHVTEYPNAFGAMCDLRNEVRAIHTRWKAAYYHDDKELLRFADAFREYWIEQDAIYRKIEETV